MQLELLSRAALGDRFSAMRFFGDVFKPMEPDERNSELEGLEALELSLGGWPTGKDPVARMFRPWKT